VTFWVWFETPSLPGTGVRPLQIEATDKEKAIEIAREELGEIYPEKFIIHNTQPFMQLSSS
jgi:hypothetical protein